MSSEAIKQIHSFYPLREAIPKLPSNIMSRPGSQLGAGLLGAGLLGAGLLGAGLLGAGLLGAGLVGP